MHHFQPSPVAVQMHALLLAQAVSEPNVDVRRLLVEQAEAALLPIGEQVQAWPEAMRHREADRAAEHAGHAAFLGADILHALARNEKAALATRQLVLSASRR